MSEQQQKEELEKILKEIYEEYHDFSPGKYYYKLEGEEIKSINFTSSNTYTSHIEALIDIISSPRIEYALYLGFTTNIRPSEACLRFKDVYSLVRLFIDDIRFPTISDKDPLSQILTYRLLMTTYTSRHFYFCSAVYHVIPYNPDPASIFPGREGIIAYCTTFLNLMRVGVNGIAETQFRKIWYLAEKKLLDDEKLKELFRHDILKACDINLIKNIIHDEIEEADKLMRQYGIIRVTLVLE